MFQLSGFQCNHRTPFLGLIVANPRRSGDRPKRKKKKTQPPTDWIARVERTACMLKCMCKIWWIVVTGFTGQIIIMIVLA